MHWLTIAVVNVWPLPGLARADPEGVLVQGHPRLLTAVTAGVVEAEKGMYCKPISGHQSEQGRLANTDISGCSRGALATFGKYPAKNLGSETSEDRRVHACMVLVHTHMSVYWEVNRLQIRVDVVWRVPSR